MLHFTKKYFSYYHTYLTKYTRQGNHINLTADFNVFDIVDYYNRLCIGHLYIGNKLGLQRPDQKSIAFSNFIFQKR